MRLFLLLGGNLGDRVALLQQARAQIADAIGPIAQVSRLYETAAWGVTSQPPYLNQVLELHTTLPPIDILDRTQAIEHTLGRVRLERWGSRPIDIDLLYYGDLVCQTDRLTLPHPLLHHRRFALVPLCEVAPSFVHPAANKTNAQLLAQCADEGAVNTFAP